MARMKVAPGADVRAAIAEHLLGPSLGSPALGDVVLHPHQRDGLARISRLLAEYGGALLADDVGLGKTFIALAAAQNARGTLVIAPASLKDVWAAAARRTNVPLRFVSFETLSRRGALRDDAELIVIDEAHHLRSAHTRRFAAASTLCHGAKVLLLSATPVQNRLADLATMLSLFLGERALGMSSDDLARFIVRRAERDLPTPTTLGLPRILPPEWLGAVHDLDCLERLLALPSPLPPADGDDGGVLLTYTLVRQWASSRAALRAALRRRLARGRAIEDALLTGRLPSRRELALWSYADGTQQLAFPELAVRGHVADAAALVRQVQRHMDAVRDLLSWVGSTPDPDVTRAEKLRELLARHPAERIVAFSEYSETVAVLYRALAPTARVAMLTHGGGRVAGGPLSRREVLARFAPGGSSRAAPSDRIDLLLSTDVLSEGVNLQDASVVVHLDLAWNPARLEQRVGRLRRIGAPRETISVYLLPPPAPTERLLGVERRLRVKLNLAARSVGVAGAILPGFGTNGDAPTRSDDRISTIVAAWRRETIAPRVHDCLAAAVRSSRDATIACVRWRAGVSLLVLAGDRITDARTVIEDLLPHATGADAYVDVSAFRLVHDKIERWLRRRVVSDVVDLPSLRVGRARRTLLHRVESIARRVPRHSQPALAPLICAARTAASVTLSAGAERVLHELAGATLSDGAWLRAVGEFAALHGRDDSQAPEILALLLLRTFSGG
jgi:hypothetical protein